MRINKAMAVCLTAVWCASVMSHAQESHTDTTTTNTNSERQEIRSLMHSFSREMQDLKSYLVSDKAFQSASGKKAIGEMLKTLVAKTDSEKAPTHIEQSPGLRINYSLLTDHFQRTQQLFEHGQFEYARMRLNGTTALCVNCHTQTPDKRRFSKASVESEPSTFENAEFLFITRKYDHAIAMGSELIRNYPANKLTPEDLTQVYRHKLAIFARVQRDPKLAIASFQGDLKNGKLPKELVAKIQDSIKAFQGWNEGQVVSDQSTDDQLIQFVDSLEVQPGSKKTLSGDETVNLLRVSGLLYERMMKPGAKVPEILRALGLCEKDLSSLYWYSLSDVYWKQCVTMAPKTPTAKKCFAAYEESMNARYKGSPPEFIRSSIEALRKYL